MTDTSSESKRKKARRILQDAITRFADAQEANSWRGSRTPIEAIQIEREFEIAKKELDIMMYSLFRVNI